jgi:hypothetical protein
MAMNYRFAADTLMSIAVDLKTYDSAEFRKHATWLMMISAEIRKMVPEIPTLDELEELKPPPNRIDPNSMIPRPKKPNGKGPADALVPMPDAVGSA